MRRNVLLCSYTDHAAMAIPPAAVQGPPAVGGPGPLGSAGGSIAVADLRSPSSNSPADIARMRVQLVCLDPMLISFFSLPALLAITVILLNS